MAYATRAQIEGEFKGITFSATTPVTDSDVDRFIAEADAEIDAMLCQRYEVPITGATSALLVRTISIKIVADRVRGVLAVKTGETKTQQAGGKSDSEIARTMLKDIVAGKMKLPDASLASSADGIQSYVANESFEPTFSRDEVQW